MNSLIATAVEGIDLSNYYERAETCARPGHRPTLAAIVASRFSMSGLKANQITAAKAAPQQAEGGKGSLPKSRAWLRLEARPSNDGAHFEAQTVPACHSRATRAPLHGAWQAGKQASPPLTELQERFQSCGAGVKFVKLKAAGQRVVLGL